MNHTPPTLRCVPATYDFEADLFLWTGDAAWHFVALPQDVSDELDDQASSGNAHRGFGSVRVRVTIGSTTWSTSVFPDKQRATFVLPVKKDVRAKEGIGAGDRVGVRLELLDA